MAVHNLFLTIARPDTEHFERPKSSTINIGVKRNLFSVKAFSLRRLMSEKWVEIDSNQLTN